MTAGQIKEIPVLLVIMSLGALSASATEKSDLLTEHKNSVKVNVIPIVGGSFERFLSSHWSINLGINYWPWLTFDRNTGFNPGCYLGCPDVDTKESRLITSWLEARYWFAKSPQQFSYYLAPYLKYRSKDQLLEFDGLEELESENRSWGSGLMIGGRKLTDQFLIMELSLGSGYYFEQDLEYEVRPFPSDRRPEKRRIDFHFRLSAGLLF